MLPELKVRAHLKAGTLVDLLPGHHLPLALCWHGWNLHSAVLDALTHARQSAAALALLSPEPQTKPISNKIV